MFGRIYLYKLKELVRNKYLVGWNFLFPLVLATAFYLGFGNLILNDPLLFETIEVGYVNTEQSSSTFGDILDELSQETDDHVAILSVRKYESRQSAIDAMNSNDVEGVYFEDAGEIETIVPANNYSSTTLNQIVREYKNKMTVLETIATEHPENLQNAIKMVADNTGIMEMHNFGTSTSPYLQYFFALIAMASLFSSWISTSMLEGICANMTEQGKRFECSPASKLLTIIAGILAGLTLQVISNAIVILYIEYILKVDLGSPIWNTILIATLGSLLGISVGVLIGSLIKNQTLLVTVPLCFTMTCSFCSGLMWHQIRQVIENNAPIINRINPAALLTDSLYTRATYGTTSVYYRDISTMCVIIVICLLLSAILLRRRKYVNL